MRPEYLEPKVFPEFDFGDFILREQQEIDLEDFSRYYSNPEVNKFILCEIPGSEEEMRRELYFWRNVFYRDDGIYFAIADKETNRMIGSIGLSGYNRYHNRIEISYDLAEEFWRRGITTRAIKFIVKYGFEKIGANRIEAFVSTKNIPSEHLLLKCGFEKEGILRQHRYHKGSYVDVYSFSVVRSNWNNG